MRKTAGLVIAVSLVSVFLGCGRGSKSFDEKTLQGKAEDLWGDTIDLSEYDEGLTLVHPFSPSNCGYCLSDETFTDVNYRVNTVDRGGSYFGFDLFNPQLDIYSFEKHYRESVKTITSPVSLYGYHKDGFPWMIAFRNGKRIYSDSTWPYETTYKKLRTEFWKEEVPLTLTSDLQLMRGFIWENKSRLAVVVIPDEAQAKADKDSDNFIVKHESELTEDDLNMNLYVEGPAEKFKLRFLEGARIPVKITSESIGVGDYEFPKSDVGLTAAFPNPLNTERVVVLSLRGRNIKKITTQTWVDYTIYGNGPDGEIKVLVCGMFDRTEDGWKPSTTRMWVSGEAGSFCRGLCPVPGSQEPVEPNPAFSLPRVRHETNPLGEMWTLGGNESRFPSLAAAQDTCWVVWEEAGDVIMAGLAEGGGSEVMSIENDKSDSFNPIIALDRGNPWVFYLNDRDGFYRLYGRYGDKAGLYNEVVISDPGAMDAITPAAAFDDHGNIVLAWTEWKSNYRYLMYRTIQARMLGPTKMASIKESDIDYTNAWYPSLAIDASGQVWGAWNQHYPLVLGVYVGNLVEEAMPVSEDKGGYPSFVLDGSGKRWVFWETFMWDDVLKGRPQKIQGAYYNSEKNQWSLPDNLAAGTSCAFNQTPRASVDGDGVTWVAWSGRVGQSGPWGIYLSRSEDGRWSKPVLVSAEGENARAPAIFAGGGGGPWIAWHSGTGSQMKIKVLRYAPGEVG